MIQATKEKIFDFFLQRKLAYQIVFGAETNATFAVLQDLARFCRAHQSTFHPDARVQAQLEGRREVWLRIQEQLQLSEEQIYSLHTVKNTKG